MCQQGVSEETHPCAGSDDFSFCLLISNRLEVLWHTTSQFYTNITVEVRHFTRLLTLQSTFYTNHQTFSHLFFFFTILGVIYSYLRFYCN